MTDEEFQKFQKVRDEINRRPLTDIIALKKSKGSYMYCCPICGSGTGKNQTGALKIYPDNHRVFCYANECFTDKGEDTLGALCKIWNCNSLDVIKRLGYDSQNPQNQDRRNHQIAPDKISKKPETSIPDFDFFDFTEQYKIWHQTLLESPQALAYLTQRGFTRETIDRFQLGFCPDWSHPKNPNEKVPRIIIPIDPYFYKARRIDGHDSEKKYLPIGSIRHLFHTDAFSDDCGDGPNRHLLPCFVVEGELDAMAIIQGGYERVIALGSTGNTGEFVRLAKEQNPTAVYILILDNDGESQAGQKAQKRLAEAMEAEGLYFISADTNALYGPYKDAGEAAIRDDFWRPFADLIRQGYYMRKNREDTERLEAYYRSGPGMVDLFLQEIKGEKYKPLSTGISSIDQVLSGGFIRQTIVMLGAAPGMGKTALASQISENIAKSGIDDVLYINLEMSREQLLARSLARIAYQNGYHKISTTEILQGYRWTIETEEAVYDAAEIYKATTAQHLIYNPGESSTDLDIILQKIQSEKTRLNHAPIVILDYLQLLTGRTKDGRDEDTVTTIKRAIQQFKEYAIRENTIVFIITANNRASMSIGDSGLNSGRDTSNIEYGADVHLGLVYTAIDEGEKKKDEIDAIKAAYYQNPKDITARANFQEYCARYTLKVNKNRHGPDGGKAKLVFNGTCAMFTALDLTHKEPRQNQITTL